MTDNLKIIKDVTSQLIPGCRVLLFGSRSRQDYTPDSDYDFLIITKDYYDMPQKRYFQSVLRKKLAQYKIPADIIMQSEAEIETKKEITGHIVKQIMIEGISL
jgi:predicted nucleotidyltransferase